MSNSYTTHGTWTLANGGTEPERAYNPIDGNHYTYMWNFVTREHAWYCHETDMFRESDPFNQPIDAATSLSLLAAGIQVKI